MAKRKVHLHGRLGEKFGSVLELEVATAGEAIRALNANFPDVFAAEIKEGSYYVIRGDEETGMGLEEEHLATFVLGDADLHIIPVVEGSQGGGGGRGKGGIKSILGIALLAVAIFMPGGIAAAGLGATAFTVGGMSISWGTIALVGLSMAVAGASSMLSKKEKPKDETKREDSFSFAGPINTNEQGGAIPLIYGRVMTGGMPISSGIDVENIGSGTYGSAIGGPNQVFINGQWMDVDSAVLAGLNRL